MRRMDRRIAVRYRSSRESTAPMDNIRQFAGDGRSSWYLDPMNHANIFQYIRWTVVEAIGLGIEFGLWIVSTHFIWGLQMALAKKLMITAIFAIRLG